MCTNIDIHYLHNTWTICYYIDCQLLVALLNRWRIDLALRGLIINWRLISFRKALWACSASRESPMVHAKLFVQIIWYFGSLKKSVIMKYFLCKIRPILNMLSVTVNIIFFILPDRTIRTASTISIRNICYLNEGEHELMITKIDKKRVWRARKEEKIE